MSLLLIVADSVRHDALGCMHFRTGGSPFGLASAPVTPTVDSVAREGVLFERVITAAPWTVPSLGSMLTGVYAHRLGLARWEQPWPAHASLFELARRQGYEVGSFVFDPEHLFSRVPEARVQGSSQDTSALLGWLEQHRRERFFLFVHYWWTHIPYLDKPTTVPTWRMLTDHVLAAVRAGAAARAGVQRLYAQGVERFSESWLPRVLDSIDLDQCWVAITADHGESWGERTPEAPPADVFDLHGNALYDEVLRIPWILRPPGGTAARRIPELVRSVDMTPTLASLLGHELEPGDGGLDGRDLSGAVRGGPVPELDAVSVRSHDYLTRPELPSTPAQLYAAFALTSGRWKQIWEPATGRREAYDLGCDAGETVDIAGHGGPELEAGWQRLEREFGRAEVGQWQPADMERLGARLRQWGYLE